VTSYAFDALGATFDLSYDTVGQQYVLLAKTAKTWVGQTHTLTVTLDDNSVHTQEVKFWWAHEEQPCWRSCWRGI